LEDENLNRAKAQEIQMNSQTITMEREAATKKLSEYEDAARRNPKLMHEVDRGILLGYRVIAKGGRLIDVNSALKNGGLNLAKLPRLAISRAHSETCIWREEREGRWVNEKHVGWIGVGGGKYKYANYFHVRKADDRTEWTLHRGTFEPGRVYESRSPDEFKAMVPLIPLPLRPRHDLSNYFILWEANWHPEPPRDPYLLKPLAGSLMEIIAEWELTDLEIAAVANALRP
jgi:hypothetical protein